MENVGGYFTMHPDANFIVFGAADPSLTYRIIFHEYAHYVVHRNTKSFIPLWLDEGLAEFYSTFEPQFKGGSLVGKPLNEHVRNLRGDYFLPLRQIVSPREVEKLWRSQNQLRLFYAEAWALVHYLMVERKNPVHGAVNVYLKALRQGKSQDDAFMEAFGVDVDSMDRELRQYVRRVSFGAAIIKAHDVSTTSVTEPVREADVRALQGSLLIGLGAADEAENEVKAALTLDPAHMSARVSLARVRLSQERYDEAIALLRDVLKAGPADVAAQYYLGAALNQTWRHEEAIAAFDQLTRLDGENPFAWLGLSDAALALKRDSQADAALRLALQLGGNPGIYLQHARTALMLGRNDSAAAAARAYIEHTGMAEEAAQYASFLEAIAYRRSDRAAQADTVLTDAQAAIPANTWTFAVLQFLQGKLAPEQLLAKAKSIGEKTEGHTYIAFQAELAGRGDEALIHLRWVAEQGAKNYSEYTMAKNELARLQHDR